MRNVARQARTTATNDQKYALSFTRGLPDLYLDRAGPTPTLAGSAAAAGPLVCSDVAGVRRSRNALLVSVTRLVRLHRHHHRLSAPSDAGHPTDPGEPPSDHQGVPVYSRRSSLPLAVGARGSGLAATCRHRR